MTNLEAVLTLVETLSPMEKRQLVQSINESLAQEKTTQPRRSLYGIWADLAPAPSAEDIDEVRREMT